MLQSGRFAPRAALPAKPAPHGFASTCFHVIVDYEGLQLEVFQSSGSELSAITLLQLAPLISRLFLCKNHR